MFCTREALFVSKLIVRSALTSEWLSTTVKVLLILLPLFWLHRGCLLSTDCVLAIVVGQSCYLGYSLQLSFSQQYL